MKLSGWIATVGSTCALRLSYLLLHQNNTYQRPSATRLFAWIATMGSTLLITLHVSYLLSHCTYCICMDRRYAMDNRLKIKYLGTAWCTRKLCSPRSHAISCSIHTLYFICAIRNGLHVGCRWYHLSPQRCRAVYHIIVKATGSGRTSWSIYCNSSMVGGGFSLSPS